LKISATDDMLVRFSVAARHLLRRCASLETRWLASQLSSTQLDSPIYICGLARSGSTILLELIASLAGIATHRYSDFPFVFTPYLWNAYQEKAATDSDAVERPHQDRIKITRHSPESMEEPLWMSWFPNLHRTSHSQLMGSKLENANFEVFYRDHQRKLLLIRHGNRYAAKNNYNLARIEYLARLFPAAKFIIPIRNPFTQVQSLVRQHQLFCEYHRQEPRVARYLSAAGHFEFGPQRQPYSINPTQAERVLQSWAKGWEHSGYAIQWNEMYEHVLHLQELPELAKRMHVMRHEDFCAEPTNEFSRLLDFLDIAEASGKSLDLLATVSSSPRTQCSEGELRDGIWGEVRDVAQHFGYAR
jgi:hypothetical protein